MKSLILSSFVVIGIAQQIKCPDEIDRSVYCTQEYAPVCAYNTQGFQIGTYTNSCFACIDESIVSYQNDPCIISTLIIQQSSSDDSTTESIVVYPCNFPKIDGLTIDCVQIQRRYVDYLTKMFHAQKNLVLYGMYSCISCTSFNVESYFYGDCNDYSGSMLSQIRAQNLSLNSELKQIINYECSQTKPTSCDDNVSEVCASYHCKDSTCNQEYTNECQACQDSTTLSYQRNSCEFSDGKLLTLAIIIQLLL